MPTRYGLQGLLIFISYCYIVLSARPDSCFPLPCSTRPLLLLSAVSSPAAQMLLFGRRLLFRLYFQHGLTTFSLCHAARDPDCCCLLASLPAAQLLLFGWRLVCRFLCF
jgi:hypothetical protein